MITLTVGKINHLPLPVLDDPSPSAIQLLGVIKLRRPGKFDLDSLASLKRASAGEGGASSGGYLLSSLALDPHSLIILSTAPLLLHPDNRTEHPMFNVFVPEDAIPSYKGDSFDIEYVLVRKRLEDGHLELSMVLARTNQMSVVLPRIVYSRDCPCLIVDPKVFSLETIKRQLRSEDEAIHQDALTMLVRQSKSERNQQTIDLPTVSFSVKDHEGGEVAIVKHLKASKLIEVHLKQSVSTLKAEIYRHETIDDLFSSSEATARSSSLVYKKELSGLDMVVLINLEDIPDNYVAITCSIFKIQYALALLFDDHSKCTFDI